MERFREPLTAGSALLGIVLGINLVEFAGLAGQFPGVGLVGVFVLAFVGITTIFYAVVFDLVSSISRTNSKAFVRFGLLLLLGCVPLYLMFGCVFYGCAG